MAEEKRSIFPGTPHDPELVEYLEKLMGADEGFAGHVLEIMAARNLGAARISAADM